MTLEYQEIMEGISNLKSKDVNVGLNIKDNDDTKVFGGITILAGKNYTYSEDSVNISIQIGTYY